ncbi:dihydropteroate synthase [Anopheles sinensis]|uniref:Dihydropteroate synthase n=1 Tax=Anopheles sinensis TaxID=74873 RepID=A0A084W769_ANOSI|nr:dihydropteroate synthase [Anopheles sinensis]
MIRVSSGMTPFGKRKSTESASNVDPDPFAEASVKCQREATLDFARKRTGHGLSSRRTTP